MTLIRIPRHLTIDKQLTTADYSLLKKEKFVDENRLLKKRIQLLVPLVQGAVNGELNFFHSDYFIDCNQ